MVKRSERYAAPWKLALIEQYKTGLYTCAELARLYGVHPPRVCILLQKHKIPINNLKSQRQRKYTINEHYFDVIDTPAKAYFLGLLYADGCNQRTTTGVCISLQERDRHILEDMNKEIGSNKPLNVARLSDKCKQWQNACILNIHSKHMSTRLTELGCVPCKSLRLQFPTSKMVPTKLLRHFILGYFDGDGHISLQQSKKYNAHHFTWSIVSTKDFCCGLQSFVTKKFGYYTSITRLFVGENDITHQFTMSGQKIFAFMKWLYHDSPYYLSRKHTSYLEGLSILEQKLANKKVLTK